jgi:hypothetical protein
VSVWWSRMTRWPQVARAFRRPSKLILYIDIALVALAVQLLARLKLPRLATLLGRGAASTPDPARIRDLVASVAAVLQFATALIRPTCITRGLVLYHFLRRAGLDVQLCFGAGYPQGQFEAHCWLVYEEKPFMEPRDPRQWFTELYRMSPRRDLSHVRSDAAP